MVFLVRNHLFLEKKMVFGGLLLVKPSSSRLAKKMVFRRMVAQSHLFLEKNSFEPKKPSFSRENKKKHLFQNYGAGASKRCFFWFSREQDVFFGSEPSFLRKKDGFSKGGCSKTIFFSRKRWFRTKKTIFFSRKPKKPSFWRPQPHSFGKDGFFVFLLVFWVLLVSCFVVFSLDLARTRLPPAVGPWGG